MYQIDPKVTFWLGVIVTIATGVGGGTVQLTNALPADWIPMIQAWNNIVAFFGATAMTAMTGMSSRAPGPLVTQ